MNVPSPMATTTPLPSASTVSNDKLLAHMFGNAPRPDRIEQRPAFHRLILNPPTVAGQQEGGKCEPVLVSVYQGLRQKRQQAKDGGPADSKKVKTGHRAGSPPKAKVVEITQKIADDKSETKEK